MVEVNRSRYATAFTQSIEAGHGVSTGVSAADRVQTIQCALRSTLERNEVVSPGHVFPLIARPGGTLERDGHTEAAVDLAGLAGLSPAGVLCELMNPDGTMARGAQVARFARDNGCSARPSRRSPGTGARADRRRLRPGRRHPPPRRPAWALSMVAASDGASSSGRACLTTVTGMVESCASTCDTDPSIGPARPPRPRAPTTMASQA